MACKARSVQLFRILPGAHVAIRDLEELGLLLLAGGNAEQGFSHPIPGKTMAIIAMLFGTSLILSRAGLGFGLTGTVAAGAVATAAMPTLGADFPHVLCIACFGHVPLSIQQKQGPRKRRISSFDLHISPALKLPSLNVY